MSCKELGTSSCSSGGYRSRTRRRPRPRYRVFSPSVFEHAMDLIFAETPRFAASVLLTWLFEDEDEYE